MVQHRLQRGFEQRGVTRVDEVFWVISGRLEVFFPQGEYHGVAAGCSIVVPAWQTYNIRATEPCVVATAYLG